MSIKSIPSTPIRYDLDLSGAKTHRIKTTMTIHLEGNNPVDVALPAVTPGAPAPDALGHAARLLEFQVTDQNGNPVPVEKLGEGEWRIHREKIRGGVGSTPSDLKVSYTLKADEFDDCRNQLNTEHAHLNGSATFLYVKGHDRDLSSIVKINNMPARSWDSISTLSPVTGEKHCYFSRYFQDLADSHFEAGKFEKVKTFLNGTEVTVALHGRSIWKTIRGEQVSPGQTLKDFSKIYGTFLQELGKFPSHRYHNGPKVPEGVEQTDRYVIIKHYLKGDTVYGGLEHFHGQEVFFGEGARKYIKSNFNGNPRLLEGYIMTHELLHKFLAKYVQHQGIDSCDLSKISHTDGLWMTEGVEDWLAHILFLEAGFFSSKDFLRHMGDDISRYKRDYFKRPANAREDSMEAYGGNKKYYNKGLLTGLALDLEIRKRTGGKRSLLDLLRSLKDEFGGTGKYFTLEDVERLTEKVAGSSCKEFFDDYLRNHKPIDFNRYLGYAGYALQPRPGTKASDGWEVIEELPQVSKEQGELREAWLGRSLEGVSGS